MSTSIIADAECNLNQKLRLLFQPSYAMSQQLFMELYTDVYNYCTGFVFDHGNDPAHPNFIDKSIDYLGLSLYNLLHKLLEDITSQILEKFQSITDELTLIKTYILQWESYSSSSLILNGVCGYFNRYWVKSHRSDSEQTHEVIYLAIIAWRDAILKKLHVSYSDAILKFITDDRNGKSVDRCMLRKAIDCLVQLTPCHVGSSWLDTYIEFFETKFISETMEYYRARIANFLANKSQMEYVRFVEYCLEEERKRCERSDAKCISTAYLHESTILKLQSSCYNIFITEQLSIFCNEFKQLLHTDQHKDLHLIYQLIKCLEQTEDPLTEILQEHITGEGLSEMEKLCNGQVVGENAFVETLLKVYRKYLHLIPLCFDKDVTYVSAMDKACEKFFNINAITNKDGNSKCTELFAKHCDGILSQSNKKSNETDVEQQLENAMIVFKYLHDKDVFIKYHCKLLAKRLINKTLFSEEAEEYMINKLKQACGCDYTFRLERMMKDMNISKELNTKFKEYLEAKNLKLNFDFSIEILSSGHWPFAESPSLAMPMFFEQPIKYFTEYYAIEFSSRKLNWLFNLCRGELYLNCFRRRYIIQGNTFQMALLLQYNEALSYTAEQLLENTKIEYSILMQLLKFLVKSKLLLCSDAEEDMNMSSVFELVSNYRNKKLRVNITQSVHVEERQQQDDFDRHIDMDRQNLIQAAAVRIMKMRRKLNHNQLTVEILEQLSSRFKPTIVQIKKAIDILIEREFIKRAEEQKDLYIYIS